MHRRAALASEYLSTLDAILRDDAATGALSRYTPTMHATTAEAALPVTATPLETSFLLGVGSKYVEGLLGVLQAP